MIQPKNREDVFDGTPYKISVAAFIADSTAVMIHAETVADMSGKSDYSNLTQYFTSSSDNNAEIVVSIIHHVESCEDTAANRMAIQEIQSQAAIIPVE